jgi:hypothetical protein
MANLLMRRKIRSDVDMKIETNDELCTSLRTTPENLGGMSWRQTFKNS